MAVVTKFGSAYPQKGQLVQIDAKVAEGEVDAGISKVDIANGDSIGSLLYLARVPSNSLIYAPSRVYNQAITGAACHIGFYNPNGGTLIDVDALAVAVDLATADLTVGKQLNALNVLNMDMRAWQLAGLAADPGGMLDVVATLTAAATAGGRMLLALYFSDHS
jgi:hypothetical protein